MCKFWTSHKDKEKGEETAENSRKFKQQMKKKNNTVLLQN